jgi:hypothetical protein
MPSYKYAKIDYWDNGPIMVNIGKSDLGHNGPIMPKIGKTINE